MPVMALQMTWHPQHQRRRKGGGGGGPPLGLKNLGSTCYLNSVLQCLAYTPPLAQFCLSSLHSSLCKSRLSAGKECAFCILERQIARCLTVEGPAVEAPMKMLNRIALFAEHFRLDRQEDAHEFLRYVIDACHNACLSLLKKEQEKKAGRSIMTEIFGGALLSQVKCHSCHGESNKVDEIMDINLDLQNCTSLDGALARFFHPEILDGNNKYNCSKCKKLSVARKQMFIRRAPNVLVIQLKRFEGIYGKITRSIEFEEVLNLSKFMCSTRQDSQPDYNLFGSIVHSGPSQESGHYYAYIKDPSGRWYCCNDSAVSLSSAQNVLSEKVYILFYIRNSQEPKSSITGSPCNGKSLDSNGSGVSSSQKSELLRSPMVKPNGVHSSKNNIPLLRNGKVSSISQTKTINFKNLETKKIVANGNGKVVVHINGGVGNNGCSKPLPGSKSTTLPENGHKEDAKVLEKPRMSPKRENTVADAISSIENDEKQVSKLSNGNSCSTPQNIEPHVENATQDVEVVKEKHCTSLSSCGVSENSGSSATKRKSPDVDTRSSDFCTNHNGELGNFKEVIAAEASTTLRSCGWVERMECLMSKRIRILKSDGYSDDTELKKLMIMEAKKALLPQVPEPLKERLIERLKTFSKTNSLFGS